MNTLSFIWMFLISFNCCINDTNIELKDNYCLISNIFLKNGKYYIEADYVQYLVGDKAIEAAKKAGDADFKVVNGEKKYSIPNDVYIINENSKLHKLELSEKVKINLVKGSDFKTNDFKGIFNYFKNNFKDKIFLLKLKKGKVNEINEIFTP